MQYEEVQPISKQEAEKIFQSNDEKAISECLLRIAYYEPDVHWVQKKCLILFDHVNLDIRRNAIISIGHLARIHKQLDLMIILPKLKQKLQDSQVVGVVEDVLDDIVMFVPQATVPSKN